MKRITMISVIAVLALLLSFSAVFAAGDAITVYLDGEQISLTTDAVLEGGTTLVPFRSIFEALGLEVGWEQETKTVSGSSEGIEIELVIDSTTALVNGVENTLDVAPVLRNNSTMIPLRFVAEAAGCKVEWVGPTSQVKIWTVDERAEEIMAKINEAADEDASLAMKMTMKADVDYVEDGVAGKGAMTMTGDVKVAVDGENVEMSMVMNSSVTDAGETENVDMEMYFKDNVMYMIVDGEKVKLEMDADEAAAQMQVQAIDTTGIEFDDSIKGSKVEESNGNYIITLVMDANAMNDILETSLQQSFSMLEGLEEEISVDDITFAYDDIIYKVVVDSAYNMKSMSMKASADLAMGSDSMSMDMEISMEITATGADVKIEAPKDLNNYVDFSEYLQKLVDENAA